MKRIFDIVLAISMLILLSPLLLVLMVLVRAKLGSPIFFIQPRPGLHGKVFNLVKFRSMTDARDADGQHRPDSDRLTTFGRWLRATSLDELPELWNILRGEMSFVGPRPLLVAYLDRYSPEQARRHEVRPGITGWAQINGRNATTWEERFAHDIWYVDHHSLGLDLKIIAMTVGKVVRREGVSPEGADTMPEFKGDQS